MNDKYFVIVENFWDEQSLQYFLGNNQDFKRFWFSFGRNLGFYDRSDSFANPYGREIQAQLEGNTLKLKRNRPDSRLHVIISNIKFTLDPTSFEFEKIRETNLEAKDVLVSTYKNYTNQPEDIVKTLKLTKSSTTIFSSSHKIATSVGLTASTTCSVPMYSDTREVNFKFSYEYTMGNQKEQTETTQTWDDASFTLPPKTKITLKLIVYTSLGSVEFTSLVNISFKVTFRGWISYYDNCYKDQDKINPRKLKHGYGPLTATFGDDKTSALVDIRTQIANRGNPDSTTLWDWDKFLDKTDTKRFVVPNLYKEIGGRFNGRFDNIDSTNLVVEFGSAEPL